METQSPTLIFVYNADGGWLNALRDMVHKIVSPATYPCSLCALTYGAFAMHPEWRAFLARGPMRSLFLYRDEFRSEIDTRALSLPTILLGGTGCAPRVLVSAAELDGLPDLAMLIALLEARLASLDR